MEKTILISFNDEIVEEAEIMMEITNATQGYEGIHITVR